MECAGKMTASFVHELAQPLSAILSNVETAELLMTRPVLDRTELAEILADIKHDNSRAVEITRRMRAFLRNQKFHFKPPDVNQVIASTPT